MFNGYLLVADMLQSLLQPRDNQRCEYIYDNKMYHLSQFTEYSTTK